MPRPIEIGGPHRLPEWIDYNGHMNVAYYVLAFDRAFDRVCDRIDLGADYVRRANGSIFVLEMHVSYLREVMADDPLRFTWQLLDHDDKRFHFCMSMYHASAGFLAAVSEQLALHVDLASRRAASFPAEQRARLAALAEEHRLLPRPAEVGRLIGIRRKATV